jgi:hypothetical protein
MIEVTIMSYKCTLVTTVLLIAINIPADAKNIGTNTAKKQSIVSEQLHGTTVSFAASQQISQSSITVSGPAGFGARKLSTSGLTSLDLSNYGQLADGLYNYEITINAGELMLFKDTINNGRGENDKHYGPKGITHSGHFRVEGGSIKTYKQIKEVSAGTDF